MSELTPEGIIALVREAVRAEVSSRFDALERLVDRRVSEVSAEVHGAAQLMDYSEANLSAQISRVQEQISTIVAPHSPDSRNSGMELETIIQVTDTAANRILEAAEAIDEWVRGGASDPESLAQVNERISAIFEACAFQDLTSQRVRRTIDHLESVKKMLGGMMDIDHMMPGMGSGGVPQYGHHPARGPDLAQDEIDKLLT